MKSLLEKIYESDKLDFDIVFEPTSTNRNQVYEFEEVYRLVVYII